MNKNNLELLGLTEPVTETEIKEAYEAKRTQYLEERFADGEKGNNAAKMLTKIETAYNELLNELAEKQPSSERGSGSAYEKVEEYIRSGDLSAAQHTLDSFNERNAQWHYLQSVVFYRKNWINESKKQLEIAIQLDPENEKYKESLRKMTEKMNASAQGAPNPNQGAYQGQDMNSVPEDQMGGDFCANCLEMCYCSLCLNCLCNSCR